MPRSDVTTAEDVALRLNEHHEIVLDGIFHDELALTEPMHPLCSPDCPGLCVECGERLGPDHVEHEVDEVDPRMAALKGFRVDGDGESG